MGKHIIDVIYNKKKDHLSSIYRILKIASIYDNPLDKEVLLILDALENKATRSNDYISNLLRLIMPMNPYEWITSKHPMFSFASESGNRTLGQTVLLKHIYEPISRLVEIYKEYGSMQSYCKSKLPIHPQVAIYQALYGIDGNIDYEHIGIARAVMILTRKNDTAGLGIWNIIKEKELRIPINRYILSSARSFKLINGSKNAEKELFKRLLKLDKKDPLKYIAILEDGTVQTQAKNMGYVITT